MGKTLKVVAKYVQGDFSSDCYIRTSKEIKVNLVIVDTHFKPVYTCNLPLTSTDARSPSTAIPTYR